MDRDLKKLSEDSSSHEKMEFLNNLHASSQNLTKVRGAVTRSNKMRQTFNKVSSNINKFLLYQH